MRICLVYDCMFPHTVGGAERWYRSLSERLAADGHEVTYLTLRQWDRGNDPGVPGVDVRVVGPRMHLYAGPGRRRILPPVVFGLGVFIHLLRHGRRYDVVHTASFPYFSLLAAAVARRRGVYRLVVDWHEVWTREYWREYLGRRAGDAGWWVQRLCVRLGHKAFCFSQLHAQRLRDEGFSGDVTVLPGEYAGRQESAAPRPAESIVLFAGRHIPEKQVPAIVPAIAAARRRVPQLRAVILGDGPEREFVRRRVAELGWEDVIDVPGFVATERVEELMASAECLLLPSRREGYGMVVIEAASWGTPSIVVAGPDNAAVELIDEGNNGVVSPSVAPDALADAIVHVHEAGDDLRRRTARWFDVNAPKHSLERSVAVVLDAYGHPAARS